MVERPDRLSNTARVLTWGSALAFALIGVVLFVAPNWSATRLPWQVSAFVAMTMGGWSLGTAAMAWLAARDWRWGVVYPALIYLWCFALLELGVLVWFRDSVRLGTALAWPYVGALAVALVAGVVGAADLIRLRPAAAVEGPLVARWVRGGVVAFVLGVGFIALVAAVKSEGAMTRRVFPEPLGPFTLRAFGAFYVSLVVGAIPLLWARRMPPLRSYLIGGEALIVPITAAALVYLDRFDFGSHPLQALYFGAYVVAGAGSLLALRPRVGSARSGAPSP